MAKKPECSAAERESADEVVTKLYRLLMRAHEFDARPREFGTGMVLSRAEIHTVQAVGRAGEMNMTALAAALGVTKGAASQMVTRLAGKGLIEKRANPKSAREVTLVLTPLGKRGHAAHESFHDRMAGSFKAALGARMLPRLEELGEAIDDLIRVIDTHERRTRDI